MAVPRFLVLALAILPPIGAASGVGGVSSTSSGVDEHLLEELGRAFGGDEAATAFRQRAQRELPDTEAAMLPLLAALPRNAEGRMESPVVRYALHRHFVSRRGWRVMGLDPEGEAWNSSSAAEADILDKMPPAVGAALRKRLVAPSGVETKDVPLIAVTFEHFIHAEASGRLRTVYQILRIPVNDSFVAGEERVLEAMDVYMASPLLGYDLAKSGIRDGDKLLGDFPGVSQVFPSWPRLRKFVHERVDAQLKQRLGRSTLTDATGSTVGLTFAETVVAAEEVSDGYGTFLHGVCSSLKDRLIQLEDHGTGRVRLADFYGGNVNGGTWQFGESVTYLKQLGALDESNPGNKRVIIPNYITGLSNCLSTVDYHSLCCMNECDALMGHLERTLGAPEATPDEIATLVSALPSATVSGSRALSDLMLRRLHSIAQSGVGSGRVPIHGRLFAQWMHHAYPRECPYPHFSGTTNPLFLSDWVNETGKDYLATPDDMVAHAGAKRRSDSPVEHAPWVQWEELLVPPSHRTAADAVPPLWAAVHGATLVPLTALGSFALGLGRLARSLARTKNMAGSSPGSVSKILDP